MPTLTYGLEVRCLNCGLVDVITVRRGCRWVNAGDTHIGSCYYKKNDPTKKIKKMCSHCGCDALKKQGIVTAEELEGSYDQE